MILRTTSLPGASEVLAGSIAGKRAAQALLECVEEAIAKGQLDTHTGSLILLDLSGVETAAASFLREFIDPFFGGTDKSGKLNENLAPAFTGIGSKDLEAELVEFFKGRSLAVRYSADRKNGQSGLLGELEKSVAESLEKLDQTGPSSAAELYEKFPESCSGQTTWNNRLVTITRLRLATRIRKGRTWIYSTHKWKVE